MLIVLEGLDGAGKSTQVSLLREYLEAKGPLEYIHFPRYDSPVYGELISRFLRGDFGSNEQVHPQLVALLYAEDRHAAAPLIRSSLEEGKLVLLDRYVASNVAYQCAKLSDSKEADALYKWIVTTEYGSFDEPQADLNLFLDVPLDFVANNLSHSRSGEDRSYLHGGHDIHEQNIDFQRRVRDMYMMQVSDGTLIRVDCADSQGKMLSAEEIFVKIRTLVDKKLAEVPSPSIPCIDLALSARLSTDELTTDRQ